MDFHGTNKKIFSYVILLIAFFILIFITKDIFSNLQQSLDEKQQNLIHLEKAKQEHTELETLKSKFESNQDELLQNISKYTVDFNSENIFNYIYTYVNSANNDKRGSMVMKSLNITQSAPGDIGLSEGLVSVTARFASQRALLDFLEYAVSDTSQYTFFIDTFSYSGFGQEGAFQATIPLKLFYKQ